MPTSEAVKKRLIKKIEQHLRNYHHYKIGIENVKLQLDLIMPDITVNYELREGSLGVFVLQSSTEQCAIDRIESKRALDLYEQLQKYKMIVDCIDRALEALEESELEFIKQRYFLKNTSTKVAEVMGYAESTVFVVRNRILEKLSHSLSMLPDV